MNHTSRLPTADAHEHVVGIGMTTVHGFTPRVVPVAVRLEGREPPAVYKPDTSSATMSAAGCGALASATLCPAHIDTASMSPVVSTIGAAGS